MTIDSSDPLHPKWIVIVRPYKQKHEQVCPFEDENDARTFFNFAAQDEAIWFAYLCKVDEEGKFRRER